MWRQRVRERGMEREKEEQSHASHHELCQGLGLKAAGVFTRAYTVAPQQAWRPEWLAVVVCRMQSGSILEVTGERLLDGTMIPWSVIW